MISLLLAAPDESIALGASYLGRYRDIDTADNGPGLRNGILSLWLNDQNIRSQFSDEEAKARPYLEPPPRSRRNATSATDRRHYPGQ